LDFRYCNDLPGKYRSYSRLELKRTCEKQAIEIENGLDSKGANVKKLILTVLLAIGLLLLGCTGYSEPPGASQPTTPEDTPADVVVHQEPPADKTWISPGKVQVGNFYPGARAEWLLLVHNGNDAVASFEVVYRYPDHVGEDYVKPTKEVQDWVIIADTTPVIAPKETKEILIVLAMPKDAAVFAPKWEFWISVKDTTQSGMVQTELCSRWLINMR